MADQERYFTDERVMALRGVVAQQLECLAPALEMLGRQYAKDLRGNNEALAELAAQCLEDAIDEERYVVGPDRDGLETLYAPLVVDGSDTGTFLAYVRLKPGTAKSLFFKFLVGERHVHPFAPQVSSEEIGSSLGSHEGLGSLLEALRAQEAQQAAQAAQDAQKAKPAVSEPRSQALGQGEADATPQDQQAPTEGTATALEGGVALPKELDAFASIVWERALPQLAALAAPEDWSSDDGTSPYRILRNYLAYTYARVAEQGKVSVNEDGTFAAFDTGLLTPTKADVYACFSRGKKAAKQGLAWALEGFADAGSLASSKLGKRLSAELKGVMPLPATYFSPHSAVVYSDEGTGPRTSNLRSHVVGERLHRFPRGYLASVTGLDDDRLDRFVAEGSRNEHRPYTSRKGSLDILAALAPELDTVALLELVATDVTRALDVARQEVRADYTKSVPMWYAERNEVDVLLPLRLGERGELLPLLLGIGKDDEFEVRTVLTIDMARTDARLLREIEGSWLARAAADPDVTLADERSACLVWEGRIFSLWSGATIGRDVQGKHADITLSGPTYAYASRLHGRFDRDGETWTFTSLGKNGTRLRRASRWIDLATDEPYVLQNGDRLQMGRPAGWHEELWTQLVTFSTIEPDLDVTPPSE